MFRPQNSVRIYVLFALIRNQFPLQVLIQLKSNQKVQLTVNPLYTCARVCPYIFSIVCVYISKRDSQRRGDYDPGSACNENSIKRCQYFKLIRSSLLLHLRLWGVPTPPSEYFLA